MNARQVLNQGLFFIESALAGYTDEITQAYLKTEGGLTIT